MMTAPSPLTDGHDAPTNCVPRRPNDLPYPLDRAWSDGRARMRDAIDVA